VHRRRPERRQCSDHLRRRGAGFTQEPIEKALEPFSTTKITGTGLGLAIVLRLARANGGEVSIGNRPTGGAAITLRLPRSGS